MNNYERTKQTAAALVKMDLRRQETQVNCSQQPILLALLGQSEWLCRLKIGDLVKAGGGEIYNELMKAIELQGLVISRPMENSPGGLRKRKEFQLTDLGADKIDYIINGGSKP